MKIISKFSDFYDSCSYMCGEDIVYERNIDNIVFIKEEFSSKIYQRDLVVKDLNELYKNIYSPYRKYRLTNNQFLYLTKSFLIIGEKLIPYVEICRDDSKKIVFTFEKLSSIMDTQPINWWSKNNYQNYFEMNHNDFHKKVRKFSNAPIISFSDYEDEWSVPEPIRMLSGCCLNPSLKKLGFSKILQASEVLQEIEMFINKLNTQEKEVNMSDKVKIHQAGFDKNSFRKGK